MKYLDEFGDPELAGRLLDDIARTVTQPWAIMEVCGGQTHAIVKFGVDELLPPGVTLVHGPGCPVCVTPLELIERAIEMALPGDIVLVAGKGHEQYQTIGTQTLAFDDVAVARDALSKRRAKQGVR
mgnify:CR=1 FL=1